MIELLTHMWRTLSLRSRSPDTHSPHALLKWAHWCIKWDRSFNWSQNSGTSNSCARECCLKRSGGGCTTIRCRICHLSEELRVDMPRWLAVGLEMWFGPWGCVIWLLTAAQRVVWTLYEYPGATDEWWSSSGHLETSATLVSRHGEGRVTHTNAQNLSSQDHVLGQHSLSLYDRVLWCLNWVL